MMSDNDQIRDDYNLAAKLLHQASLLLLRDEEAPEQRARLLRGAMVSIRDARQAIEDAARLLPKE